MKHLLRYFVLLVAMCCVPILPGQRPASPGGLGLNNTPVVVKLLSPIDTRTAKEQNTFTASVQQPDRWKGGYVEGRINHLKRPKKGSGKAEIDFAFETFTYGGTTERVTADLTDVKNSQGVSNVDDEGRVIGRSSAKKKIGGAAGGAAVGAIIGGLTHGPAGAVVGGAAGAAAGFLIAMKFTTPGSDIRFGPGSTFYLKLTETGNRR